MHAAMATYNPHPFRSLPTADAPEYRPDFIPSSSAAQYDLAGYPTRPHFDSRSHAAAPLMDHPHHPAFMHYLSGLRAGGEQYLPIVQEAFPGAGEFLPLTGLPPLKEAPPTAGHNRHLPPALHHLGESAHGRAGAFPTGYPDVGNIFGGHRVTAEGLAVGGHARSEGARRNKGQVLHRNKACLSCRSRKTKCDAIKPMCTSCKKLGAERECQYDSPPKWLEAVTRGSRARDGEEAGGGSAVVEAGGAASPEERATAEALQSKLEALEEQLKELRVSAAYHSAQKTGERTLAPGDGRRASQDSAGSQTSTLAKPNPHAPRGESGPNPSPRQHQVMVRNADGTYEIARWDGVATSPPESATSASSGSHGEAGSSNTPSSMHPYQYAARASSSPAGACQLAQPPEPENLAAVLEPGWPRTLPPRKTCKFLVGAFFKRPLLPYGLLDSGKFQARLALPPAHPLFPQASLVHAMAANGSMEVSREALGPRPYWGQAAGGAAEYHAQWGEKLVWDALMEEKDPHVLFQHSQAALVMSQYYHTKGMALQLWRNLGFCLRICTMLGLHKYDPGVIVDDEERPRWGEPSTGLWRDGVGELGAPTDAVDAYERAIVWWYAFACERVVVATAGFAVSISEDDISAPIPSSHANTPTFECHSIKSEGFFECHEEGPTGSLQLLTKCSLLLGRVTTFLQRSNHPAVALEQTERERTDLSNLIRRFFQCFPEQYRQPIRMDAKGRLDSCLLSAHCVIHTTVIHLHEDAARLSLTCPDLLACAHSARTLLDWFHHVANRSIDIGQLLCANATINFSLTVALRTHVRVLAVHEALGFPDVARQMQDEARGILKRLRGSRTLPMGGRSLILVDELLRDPSVCLPARQDIKTKSSFLRSIGRVKS